LRCFYYVTASADDAGSAEDSADSLSADAVSHSSQFTDTHRRLTPELSKKGHWILIIDYTLCFKNKLHLVFTITP